MDPILITIVSYVSLKFVDQFIKEEGYGRIKRFLFPRKRYHDQLVSIIYETIDEYEHLYPYEETDKKFPFYHSQLLFEQLNNHILFQTEYSGEIVQKIKENSNIIIPTSEELSTFFDLLVNKIKCSTKLKFHFIEENYKSKIFDIYESIKTLGQKIQSIEDKVVSINEHVSFVPNDEWFKRQCQLSIIDLGNRYTPALNLELDATKIFEGLGRTSTFKIDFNKTLDHFLIKGKKILARKDEIKDKIEKLENQFDILLKSSRSVDLCGTERLPLENLQEILRNIADSTKDIQSHYFEQERKLQQEKFEHQFYHKYGNEIRNIYEFENELTRFNSYLNSSTFKLANSSILILDGEAGIGKSHMIGDIVSRRITNGYENIFLLGQYFLTDEDPWTQIFKRLQIDEKADSFLTTINERGKTLGKRIIFFIDAINEGRGKYFWSNFIKSFISEFQHYEWIGLVLTIRSSYKKVVFPEDEKGDVNVVEHTLFGFRNVEYEASKLFFNNYKIQIPSVPLLHPEFQNPLFLKLFCEGISKSGLTKIPEGLQGISSIIDFFIHSINDILSKPNRVNYPNSLNLVKKSIDVLILYKIENNLKYVPYEKAYELVENTTSKLIGSKQFLEELVKEGVLARNLFWISPANNEEGIYLAYERFEDHLTSLFLLDNFPNHTVEFQDGGHFYQYVKDEYSTYLNKGLIDAFSIQIPEKTGKELFEFIPHLKNNISIAESFVESLLWRKVETINDISKDYVNTCVFRYQSTQNLFWETIISITAQPNHYFNAYKLHNHLISLGLPKRDSGWTQFLKYRYSDDSSVKRLIDWAWNLSDKSHISDEAIKLSSITLAWFHTSTNRQLRDCSTKALISLLQDRLNVLIEILKLFAQVDDPYVLERLFAVSYGCALRTSQTEELPALSEYIYNVVFKDKEEVYPHILLRDYARGVIEYTNSLKFDLDFEMSDVRPPYRSNWPEEISSEEELRAKYDNKNYRHIWSSVMDFGDFSRYTIGTNHNLSEWSGYKRNETPIDREFVLNKFKAKLNPEQLNLFNNLDPIISENGEGINFGTTKIMVKIATGRKSKDELEIIKSNFLKSLNPELVNEFENEIEPYLDHNHKIINTGKHFDLRIAQRLIFSRVIELGWEPKLHYSFDNDIGTGRGRNTKPHERIGKKYQWIAYYEYMARLSDNFRKYDLWGGGDKREKPYQGPWDPYIRDIDPTMLIHKTGKNDVDEYEAFWWEGRNSFDWSCAIEEWVNDIDNLPNFESLIEVTDSSNKKWLVLEGYPSWSEPKNIGEEKWDYPHKELWSQIRGYLVKDCDFEILIKWALEQNFMGRWMPECTDRYEIFSREYYWSTAHKYFKTEYYNGTAWREIFDQKSGKLISHVIVPTESFLWEEEFDQSKEDAISFLKPCSNIFDGLGLKCGKGEGEFFDSTGRLICFDPCVYNNSKSYFLIRKEPFIDFLKGEGLNIIWTVLGEKQILGGRSFGEKNNNRIEISGAYFIDNDAIKGHYSTKKI